MVQPNNEPSPAHPTLAVALSGGGHRASAWALGAMLYLVDSGAAARVRSVASVSGGSITNAFIAMQLELGDERSAFHRKVAAPLARRIATTGTIFANRKARDLKDTIIGLAVACGCLLLISVLLLLAMVVAKLVGAASFQADAIWVAAWVVPALVVVASILVVLFLVRSAIFREGYDTLFAHTRLADVSRAVEHVYCATELQSGEHIYLSPRFVYSYRLGVSPARELHLADAVLASAAFPGPFPPLKFPTSEFNFRFGAEEPPASVVLSDGGVYNNMAEQWLIGIAKRLSGRDEDANAAQRATCLKEFTRLHEPPDEVIVVNASADPGDKKIGTLKGLSLELRALNRLPLALYDTGNSLRRSSLIRDWDKARRTGQGTRGTLVHIATQPPLSVSIARRNFERGQGPNAKAELAAAQAAERLATSPLGPGNAPIDWKKRADLNCAVGTTLDPLGEETTARLLQHAYVLAAVQSCLHLDKPLPDEANWPTLFGWERFLALASGEPRE